MKMASATTSTDATMVTIFDVLDICFISDAFLIELNSDIQIAKILVFFLCGEVFFLEAGI